MAVVRGAAFRPYLRRAEARTTNAEEVRPMAQPTPQQEPKRLGGFELLGKLGKGGMGTVLKARQVSMDRLVALKVLPKKLAENEAFVQRFLREARSAAKLRHPNIVQAYDVGQAEGYYYFAMEFVDGETLSDIVRRDGPLEPNRALDVMKQVASALAAAHKEGIVHRDIKPSNIMLDKEGQVRVTDFGLAKRTEGDVEVTADGAVVGTPAYVAPEMAKGGEAEPRSDLYSLGATLFCALAGRPPFEGRNFSEVLVKQATEQAPPLASLAPRVDRRLCHIVDRLLRKNPEARYPSATALLDDLNGLGKLQSVAGAARAEGRAMLAEAPTLEMTEGKRLAMGKHPHPRPLPKGEGADAPPQPSSPLPRGEGRVRVPSWLAVAAVVAILAIAGLILALRSGSKPPDTATSVPDNRRPTTDNRKDLTAKPPEDAKKTSVPDNRKTTTEHPVVTPPPKPKETPEPKVEPVPAPKEDAAALAKWQAIKAEAKKLADAGKFDEAVKLLEAAKALPLDGIADLVAESIESIESIKSTRLRAALAAYQAESDKLWALLKARDYPAADKLLAGLVGGASVPRVPPRAGDGPPTLQDMLKADQEALAVLKEFWAAVEKGVAARKGTISIAGALGNITGVENGVITLQTPKEAVTRRVLDLTAKQALAYAAVVSKDDERSRLAEAIFRIAEGEDPALADKALAAAGNPPGLSVYKDRLAALTLGAAEVAARKAWAEIEALTRDKLSKAQVAALGNMLDKFEKEHGQSKTGKEAAVQIAALRARAGKAAEPIVYTEWPFDAAEAKRRQAESAKALGVPIEQDVDLGNGVKMSFVLIPAGEFLMGSPATTSAAQLQKLYGEDLESYQREFPQHRVRITRPFWLGKYEVTQEQWEALMGQNPSRFRGKPQNPVEMVSWVACQEFIMKLKERLPGKGFRLPREAEWEYAYRAGAGSEFYFGDDATKVVDFGWVRAHSPAQVGLKRPNGWGLYDMAGNVFEWCEDWYADYGPGAQTDPEGPPTGSDRLLRGGSYLAAPNGLRAAFRLMSRPGRGHWHVGLRVVCATVTAPTKALAEAPKAGEWPFDAAEARRRQAEAAKALGVPVEQDIDLGNGAKMTLVLIPAGEFLMGSPPTTSPEQLQKAFGGEAEWYTREFPQRRVKISRPFWLGKTEVTQAQWQAVMADNPSHFKDKPQNPVEKVSWDDCQGFLRKLSAKLGRPFRLPTEAEWEYAGRAGAATELYFGDSLAALGPHAWCAANSGASTQAVGQTKPNAWGLHDMAGNTWEWCVDWFAPYEKAPQVDPQGPATGSARVLRGGSWDHPAATCRSAYRYSNGPANRFRNIGCRVCVVATATAKAAQDLRPGEWQSLFDGKTLKGWRVADVGSAAGHGRVYTRDGSLILEKGTGSTDIAWTEEVPSADYEFSLEAMRVEGTSSFCHIAFPVGASHAYLVGGGTDDVVLHYIDRSHEPRNETTRKVAFEQRRWYEIRLRVTTARVTVWLDGKKVIDFADAERRLSLAPEWRHLLPLGVGTWQTTAALRNIRLRRIEPGAGEAPKAGEWPFDAAEARRRQAEAAKALGVEAETDIALGGGVKMTLVLIPAGEFLMGSAPATSPEQLQKVFGGNAGEFQPEFPQRRVKISRPFWLGKTEVTQAQWQAVMGENPSHFKGKPQNPVDNVSWDDCQGFLQKLSAKFKRPFRLP
ncbi:MAG: DUF1080 domain-containing protein, partial [Planctomycetes bacterium]|nr:DUF1080 domain-containing protein [Planctomycetota bacterium]